MQNRGPGSWPAARATSWCEVAERARGWRVMIALRVG